MIYKNEDGANVIEFGTGDIEVAHGFIDGPHGEPCVCFIPQLPATIGEVSEESIKKYGTGPVFRKDVHTIFSFTKPESIDVIIKKLLQAKRGFEKRL